MLKGFVVLEGEGCMGMMLGEKRIGKANGQGVNVYASGARYEGSFKDDMKDGHGVLVDASGEKQEGLFH